jgi:cytochrome c oxidase subunit III
MSSAAHGTTPYYYVPHPSRHPVMAAIGLFFLILGAGQWINGADWGMYCLFFGMAWWLIVLYQWFSEAVHESETGMYGRKIDLSYRWSMTWFIFSEVMFFGAFFTALWWARAHSIPALGSLKTHCFGLTSKLHGPAWWPVRPPRQPALLSPSKPWVLSGCPPSTPLCC